MSDHDHVSLGDLFVREFTVNELRARDERIIKESFRVARQTFLTSSAHIDAIIAAAEADQ